MKTKILFVCVFFLVISGCAAKSPLIRASEKGDIITTEKLIKEGADVNEQDSNGYTPLMHAIFSGKTETAKFLISKGADVNAKDKNGYTPLSWASSYGNHEIARLLIDKGADTNSDKYRQEDDALISAVQNRQLEIVQNLIAKGANLEAKDSSGMTPLVYVAYHYLPYSATESKFRAIKKVFKDDDKNADKSDLANTVNIMKLLIKSGADVNAKSPDGLTVLDIALSCSQWDIVAELIRTGVNLWEPEVGQSRIFFISNDLYDYLTVSVGKRSKSLNQNPGPVAAFFDVDPGRHVIDANHAQYVSKDRMSIDTKAGQTYYFLVTQNMKNRIIGYAAVMPSTLVDKVSDNKPFPILPLTESEAKQQIGSLLKSFELTETRKSNASAHSKITKPNNHKKTYTEIEKNGREDSRHGQKLRELKKLKDEGLITDEEYQKKRKAIVDNI